MTEVKVKYRTLICSSIEHYGKPCDVSACDDYKADEANVYFYCKHSKYSDDKYLHMFAKKFEFESWFDPYTGTECILKIGNRDLSGCFLQKLEVDGEVIFDEIERS